jgi:four helix bundle protein
MNNERGTMNEKQALKVRTKESALRIIRLSTSLPRSTEAQVTGKQVLRMGTSAGGQYREAPRVRSNAEFVSKTKSTFQELEETPNWLDLLADSKIVKPESLTPLLREAGELAAIFVTSVKAVKSRS